MVEKIVNVVHCVDTEGPLYESLEATFARLKEIFGIDLPPSAETLMALQNKELSVGGNEEQVAKIFAAERLAYNDSWQKIDAMLDVIMASDFRNEALDSFGNGWIYNWHCVDHVGFEENPRGRELGFHKISDYYASAKLRYDSPQDGLHFHHHPVPFSRAAHHPATHYFNHTPAIFEIISRRVIDRSWFPCVNRPGFHSTRPDSHWFLEQFVPFDIANQSKDEGDTEQRDISGGRFGDWRRAPITWTPYHPSHDDYQVPGECRRWIARCLNVGSRVRLLREDDVELAFQEAEKGEPVILAFANHDFRDIRPDVNYVRGLLAKVSDRFPGVRYRFSEAREAMRNALGLESARPIEFQISRDVDRLNIEVDTNTFGPTPFLAIKTVDGRYLHDNLDCHVPFRRWSYTFDEFTQPMDKVEKIGVASCDNTGNVTVALFDPNTGTVDQNTI